LKPSSKFCWCQYRNDIYDGSWQEYDELNMAIKTFQDTMMRVRYSSIPVVVAPHGMTLVVDAK
jgi:enoyl-CoA hydratase/carnithine racemase